MNAAGIAKEIASTTPPLKLVWLVAGSHLSFAKKLFQSSQVTRTADKKKNPSQNTIFKNQNSPKIKQQKRRLRKGRYGGDRAAFATPSLSPLQRKEYQRKNKSSRIWCGELIVMRLLHPCRVRNDKILTQQNMLASDKPRASGGRD